MRLAVNHYQERMARLKQRQQRAQAIVKLRSQGWTFAEIGAQFNITRARAHQIYRDVTQ